MRPVGVCDEGYLSRCDQPSVDTHNANVREDARQEVKACLARTFIGILLIIYEVQSGYGRTGRNNNIEC